MGLDFGYTHIFIPKTVIDKSHQVGPETTHNQGNIKASGDNRGTANLESWIINYIYSGN